MWRSLCLNILAQAVSLKKVYIGLSYHFTILPFFHFTISQYVKYCGWENCSANTERGQKSFPVSQILGSAHMWL